jgi:site-specific recombinase XerD
VSSTPEGSGCRVVLDRSRTATSPYRLVDAVGVEIKIVNGFLDACALRALSPRTLRTYAYALRHIANWLYERDRLIDDIVADDAFDFIRYLREPSGFESLAARSVNLLITVLNAFHRHVTKRDLLPSVSSGPPTTLLRTKPLFRSRSSRTARLNVDRQLVHPLRRDEVTRFFKSLRSWRDIAIASLMLFNGVRSREVTSLLLGDLDFEQSLLCVKGKGSKERSLPLAAPSASALSSYLKLERPKTASDHVFVVLKGPNRGGALSLAGLRTVFRFHRRRAHVERANPHRFRHTFGADMVRAGLSLPALQRLMGHSQITVTMRYVNLSAEDIREEFDRAIASRRSSIISDDITPSNNT